MTSKNKGRRAAVPKSGTAGDPAADPSANGSTTEACTPADASDQIRDRYHLLLMQARDVILFIEPSTGRIIEANPAAVSEYRYSRDELLSKTIRDLRAPETLPDLEEQYQKATAAGIRFETVHIRKDGTRFPVEVSSASSEVGGERLIVSIIRNITERKAAEEAFIQNQAILTLAMRSSRMGAWTRDMRTGVVWWSEDLEEIFGLPHGTFASNENAFYELVHEDDREAVFREVERAIAERRSYSVEFRFYHADGSVRWMEGRGEAVYSDTGEPIRIYGVGIDITDRKTAQAKLDQSETEFKSLFDLSGVGMAQADPKTGRFVRVNSRFCEITGLTEAELLQKPFSEITHPDDREAEMAIVGPILRGEAERWNIEKRYLRPDGEIVWAHVSGRLVKDAAGRPVRTVAGIVDITDRKRVEEELRAAIERINVALAASELGDWSWDTESDVVTLSDRAAAILGVPPGPSIKWAELQDLIHDDDRGAVRAEVESSVAQGGRYEAQYRIVQESGRVVWVSAWGRARYDDAGRVLGMYGVVQDITERRNLQDALVESEERFRSLMEQAPFSVQIFDPSGRPTQVNRAWEELWGVTLDQISEYNILKDPQLEARGIAEHIRRAFAGEVVELPIIRYDPNETLPGRTRHSNARRWVSAVAYPLRNARGEITQVALVHQDVTERMAAEAALRESEGRFRDVADAAPVLIWVSDERGGCTWFNKPWLDFTGRRMEDEVGSGWLEAVHPDDRETCERTISGSVSAREAFSIEFRLRRYSGEFRWVLNNGVPRFGPGGEFVGFIGSCIDIEDRRRSESRLDVLARISDIVRTQTDVDDLLYSVAEALGQYLQAQRCLFNEIDLENDVERVHRDYCRDVESVAGVHRVSDYSAVTTSEMRRGITVVNRDSKIDPRTAADYERTYLQSGERSYVAVPLMRDGRWVASLWASDTEPRDWDEQDVSLIETVAERTWTAIEKLRIDAALRESEERFSKAFDSSPLVLTISSLKDGRLVEVNQTFVDITGYSREEAIGRTTVELDLWKRISDREAELEAVRQAGRVKDLEYEFTTRDGREIVGLLSAERIDIAGEPFALTVIQDITARKRAEEAATKANDRFIVVAQVTNDAIWDWDLATDTLWWNDGVRTLFGYDPSEVGERVDWWYEHIHPDDRDRVMKVIRSVIESGAQEWTDEYRFLKADGSSAEVLDRGFVIRDEAGRPVRMLGGMTDLTTRKIAERQIAGQNEVLEAVMVGESLEEILSRTTAAIEGQLPGSAASVLLADDEGKRLFLGSARRLAEEYNEAINGIVIGDGVGSCGTAAYRREPVVVSDVMTDPLWKDFKHLAEQFGFRSCWSNPIVSPSGKLYGTFAIYFDEPRSPRPEELTILASAARIAGIAIERRAAENALRRSEETLRTMADTIPQLAWMADAEGYIFWYNHRWYEYTGTTPEQMEGWGWQSVHDPEVLPEVVDRWKLSLATGEPFEMEFPLRSARGKFRWFLTRVNPLRDGDGRITRWFGTNTDVDDSRRAQRNAELLAEISRDLSMLAGEVEIMTAASEKIGRFFAASDCVFSEFDRETGRVRILKIWSRDGSTRTSPPSIDLADFFGGPTVETVASAEPVVIRDTDTDPLTAEHAARFRDEGVRSFIWTKYLELGAPKYGLSVNDSVPRDWAADEIALLGELSTRLWARIERARSEEKIRQNEATLRAYYNNSPLMMGVVELDSDDAIYHVYDNPATCAFFGIPPGATAGQNTDGLGTSESVRRLWAQKYRESQRISGPVSFEFSQPVRGKTRWMSATVSPIGEGEQGRARFAYVAEDTTERKRADEEIRYQLDLTKTITDNTQSALWLMDLDGRATFVNHATERISGFKAEELIGEIIHDKIHHTRPDGSPFPADECPLGGKLNKTEPVVGYEDHFIHKNGHFYPVRCNARPIFKDGELVGTVLEVQDITDEKRAQRALLRAERKAAEEYLRLLERIIPLAEALGTARDLTSVYRSLKDFIHASMTVSAFFVSFYDSERRLCLPAYVWGEGAEIDISELPPMPISPGGGPNSQAIFERRAVITNNYWDQQKNRPHIVVNDNGRDPNSSLVVPMMFQNEVIGTLEVQAHDDGMFSSEHAVALEMAANLAAVAIQNVRLIETEAAARAEAENANRMKDEFLSVLSHELRTPLNAMLGWIRLLRGGGLDEQRSVKALEVIERNTRQQSSLIEDLLDVSRIISGKMRVEHELLDLNTAINMAAETIRPLAVSRDVIFLIEGDDEPLYLRGDVVRLQQVVTNLLQNAVKFTPAGGVVTLSKRRSGLSAEIAVRDTGIGIDPEFLPHIFDRFSQADLSTKRTNTGLGLGLTIVRNIVELHGGRISADSAGPGTGAAFTVVLPLAAELYDVSNVGRPVQPQPGPDSRPLDGVRILTVDDDEESLLPTRLLLEREGAIVLATTSAGEAVELLRTREFDILISDVGMPGLDGYELIRLLRSDTASPNRRIKAVALTAYAAEDDKLKLIAAGFDAHVTKPLDFDQLMAAIRRLRAAV